jgi:hypothetical protein
LGAGEARRVGNALYGRYRAVNRVLLRSDLLARGAAGIEREKGRLPYAREQPAYLAQRGLGRAYQV